MKGYRLSILRHGITDANENGIYIGKTDLPLSENGREALQEKYETHEYPKVQKVYTSPLERAVQSAEILFPDRELVIVDDLREMDFGVFENLSVDDLIELDSYKKWLKGGLDNPPPNGESLRNMMLRCYSALNLMILDMMKEGITHAGAVTHSGILMNMMSCFGLPKMKPMEFACDPGEGYEILVSAMMWQNGNTFEILGKIPDGEAPAGNVYP
ncbi:MAG: histidine phosphatase family protein [Oscillospiraceae bacterium]|nr:histidine phosphatase family protein [Oscillospiraceae bacterium]